MENYCQDLVLREQADLTCITETQLDEVYKSDPALSS